MGSKNKKEWVKKTYGPYRSKHPERKAAFHTSSGIDIDALYSGEETPPSATKRLGYAGEDPFTRGVYPTMYRGRPWTTRQYAGFGTARETNERFRYLLERGQKGLSIAFDLPTQMGIDSDDPRALGEVGRVGVAIDTIDDMRVVLDHIPVETVSTSMTINATASVLLAMYVAMAEERGVDRRTLAGTVQNDILKEYMARGTYIFPPAPSVRLITNMFAWCAAELPQFNPISISGYHIREAGSTAVQELAFTLADGITYVQAGIDAGLDVDAFAPRLSFFFNVHNNVLEEVSKFRAARRMWATIMRDRFGAKKTESMLLRFHTQTAGSTLTAQQPHNNIARVTLQALAAVLGGTQSLHTNSFDEALGLPSDHAAKIALRTQQVIAEESGVTDTIDPLGGSYYIESLTDELERRATAEIAAIDEMGGMVEAIDAGYPQREIERAAYNYQRAIESGDAKVIGVNAYEEEDETSTAVFRIDPKLEKAQVKELTERKKDRDQAKVDRSLAALDAAAKTDENLFPLILNAVTVRASVGEICATLERTFGRYRDQGGR
ncbi:MAG: methylmalonyl-CoA mutase family protein [Deltaproteobacteria bacterium]|nr:methylmalonyl-CoA mutase family protein [Deltaproteobacteria bacterium]